MNFVSNASIQNGSWGITKTNKDGNTFFVPLGNEVVLEDVTSNIETDEVTLVLSCMYLGERRWAEISRSKLTEYSLLQELTKIGADVTRKHFDAFVDSIRFQEYEMDNNHIKPSKVYDHLGWKDITYTDQHTGFEITEPCFRADTLHGGYNATYTGTLKIEPMGHFDLWRKMILDHVIGEITLEIVLLAGLSAAVNGLISHCTTGENPIFHLCGVSGSGKSTGAILAASVAGEPFDGTRSVSDKCGKPRNQQSVYGTWSATENAVICSCSGNHGYPIILNELGKFQCKDLSSLIYVMSEGTVKLRMNYANFENFSTTIISVGEHSMLSRCISKADGLYTRVLEIDQPLTSSAKQADTIKSVCREHNGHALVMLAKYMKKISDTTCIVNLFNQNRKDLLDVWPNTPSAERFVSKFPALLLTTADLAEKALNIKFSKEAIIDYFLSYEKSNGHNRNSAALSYDVIMEECRINISNFYRNNEKITINKAWGRIVTVDKQTESGQQVIEEYLIRPSVVKDILKKHGFENIKTCEAEWTAAELISREDAQHPKRARKIEPNSTKSERVYVFRVLADTESCGKDSGGDK